MSSRYNLKRRVASLPPISAEVFAEKVLTAHESSTAVAAKASFEKVCAACQKTYYSENAYENHIKSQKHRLRVALLAKDDTATEDGETASVISSTISLGEPINGTIPASAATNAASNGNIDPEAEAEFSKVVNGIKETKITEEPVSRRPTRPHHSAGERRPEHPLSPGKPRDDLTRTNTESSDLEIAVTHCLFCNYPCPGLDLNIQHMTKSHGLFIPEQDYLTDSEGLIRWLWHRVNDEPHECLYCHKAKSTAEAVQDHMKDLGHCKIAFEEEVDMIEVGQFYDFRSTYSDENGEDESINCDEDEEMEDGWESASDVDSEDADDKVEVDGTLASKGCRSKPRAQTRQQAIVLDNELYLPSGKTAGHRSLNRYYRQNLRDHPSPAEINERQLLLEAAIERGDEDAVMTSNTSREDNTSSRGRQLISRANGGQGMLGVTDAKKREVHAVEKRDTKRAQRAEKQYQWGINRRANMQKHFRDPLLQ